MGRAIRHNYKLNFTTYANSFSNWLEAILALLLQYDVNEKVGKAYVVVWRDWDNWLEPKCILKFFRTKVML